MTDFISPVIAGLANYPHRLKDMSDGSFAEVGVMAPLIQAGSTPNIAGGAMALPNYSGVQIQVAGMNADTLTITHSMDGVNWLAAILIKGDASGVIASGVLTGAAANMGYSVFGFLGILKILRTGSADTLTVTMRGTN